MTAARPHALVMLSTMAAYADEDVEAWATAVGQVFDLLSPRDRKRLLLRLRRRAERLTDGSQTDHERIAEGSPPPPQSENGSRTDQIEIGNGSRTDHERLTDGSNRDRERLTDGSSATAPSRAPSSSESGSPSLSAEIPLKIPSDARERARRGFEELQWQADPVLFGRAADKAYTEAGRKKSSPFPGGHCGHVDAKRVRESWPRIVAAAGGVEKVEAFVEASLGAFLRKKPGSTWALWLLDPGQPVSPRGMLPPAPNESFDDVDDSQEAVERAVGAR